MVTGLEPSAGKTEPPLGTANLAIKPVESANTTWSFLQII
jgi:hypothetical protein